MWELEILVDFYTNSVYNVVQEGFISAKGLSIVYSFDLYLHPFPVHLSEIERVDLEPLCAIHKPCNFNWIFQQDRYLHDL